MKGISTVLSHMSYIAIGIVALSLLVASVYIWGEKIEGMFLQRQLKLMSSSIVGDVLELKMISERSNLVPGAGKSILAELGAEIPDRISNDQYSVDFSSNKITVSSRTSKGARVEETVSLDFEIENSSALSPFLIRLERDSSGDKIYLVD